MTPERFCRLRQALDRRQPDLTLIADQVNKPQNLSALIRTADAVGIGHLHAVVPEEGYRDFRGTARGSGQWVDVFEHPDADAALEAVRRAGMRVVAADAAPGALDYRCVDYCQPTALVLGAEMKGIGQSLLAAADERVRIPMLGMVGALNVSVATGIILAEVQRQRWEAGLYGKCRLPATEYQELLFRWSYPRIAACCDAKGWPYPELSPEGALCDALEWYRKAQQRAG